MARRPLQEINAGSMADIAFLLLVFFLVTTDMDSSKGLAATLPPPIPEDQEPPIRPPKRNLLVVLVNKSDMLLVNGEVMKLEDLKDYAKDFIANKERRGDWPQTRIVNDALVTKMFTKAGDDPEGLKKANEFKHALDELGEFTESNAIVSLQNDRATSYKMYLSVRNELQRAYNELRDEVAREIYGEAYRTIFEEATVQERESYKEKYNAIKTAVPIKISEAEPKDIGGGTQ